MTDVLKFIFRLGLFYVLLYVLVVTLVDPSIVHVTISPITSKYSYVESISTKDIPAGLVDQALSEFNNLTDKNIVKKEGYRPIRIIENDKILDDISNAVIGLAKIKLWSCDVYIRSKYNSYEEFKKVLIHEYLHCYGYMHVNSYNDLMHNSYSENISNSSIKKYAEDLARKMYGE